MVKSNRVAVDLGDNQLASPSSKADATPLLQQGSGDYIKEASSPPKKSAARQRKSEKSSGAQQNYLPDASLQVVLEDWEPPNDKAAKLAHVKTHYHHELFSLSDTKTEDLAEFGQGLALYFYFLKWIAMLLAAMSLVVLPNMVWSAVARSSGTSSIGMQHNKLYTAPPISAPSFLCMCKHSNCHINTCITEACSKGGNHCRTASGHKFGSLRSIIWQ